MLRADVFVTEKASQIALSTFPEWFLWTRRTACGPASKV